MFRLVARGVHVRTRELHAADRTCVARDLHLAVGSSGGHRGFDVQLPMLAAGCSSSIAVAKASDLPSAVPAIVSFGHAPRTRNRPVKLPWVSGTQSSSEATARSTVASMASPAAPFTATRLLPELTRRSPCSFDGAANSISPSPAIGRPRSSPESAAICSVAARPCFREYAARSEHRGRCGPATPRASAPGLKSLGLRVQTPGHGGLNSRPAQRQLSGALPQIELFDIRAALVGAVASPARCVSSPGGPTSSLASRRIGAPACRRCPARPRWRARGRRASRERPRPASAPSARRAPCRPPA